MLGHSSATMTLDTYGHLFDDRLDEVGEAMDRALTAEEAPPSVSAGQGPLSDLYPRPDSNRRYRRERAAC